MNAIVRILSRQQCDTCKYNVDASCHRNAPTAYHRIGASAEVLCREGEWPMVDARHWCGEFKHKYSAIRRIGRVFIYSINRVRYS